MWYMYEYTHNVAVVKHMFSDVAAKRRFALCSSCLSLKQCFKPGDSCFQFRNLGLSLSDEVCQLITEGAVVEG